MGRNLLILSTVCFMLGFLRVLLDFRKGALRHTWQNLAANTAGFALQCAFLWQRGQAEGRCPLTSLFEIIIFVCWSLALFYFLAGASLRVSLLGFFTGPMIFALQSFALFAVHDPGPRMKVEGYRADPWTEMHASLSLLAYGAFALAAVAGLMYLLQDRLLKKHRIGGMFHAMPPIHLLSQTIFRLLVLGLILLTVGLLTAFQMQRIPSWQHLTGPLIVWAGYAVLAYLLGRRQLSPRHGAAAAALGYAFPLVTLWLVPTR